jgi:PBSX family phage terminase large subunit
MSISVARDDNSLLTRLAPFNTKQVAFLEKALDCWLSVLEGGKRAGKNVLGIISWCTAIDESHAGSLHLAGGVTKASAEMNIIHCNGFGVEAFFQDRCRRGTFKGMDALYVQSPNGEKIIIISGGGMKHHYTYIKGNSYETAYLTEANELHQTYFDEVLTRLMAAVNKKLIIDLNPKPPNHWFYVNFLDDHMENQKSSEKSLARFHALTPAQQRGIIVKGLKPESYGLNYGHFTIFDNMSIDIKKLRTELSRFKRDSLLWKADIMGLRVTSVGRVYDTFNAESIYISQKEAFGIHFTKFAIGIDIGGTDATVASLTGFSPSKDGVNVVLLDGYYHKQGNIQNVMSETLYVKAIVSRIKEWKSVPAYNRLRDCVIYYDSAAKLFGAELSAELAREGLNMQVVPSYKGTINDRIHLNNTLILGGRFYIVRLARLQPWIEAYENASYDPKEFAKGEFVRLDKASSSVPIDCLDSFEYSIYPYRSELI